MLTKLTRFGPSLLIFMVGTGALFGVDVVIARYSPTSNVEEWAALKALMMTGGVMALFGLDQVVVREPDKARELRRWSVINVFFIAAFVATVSYLTGYFSDLLISFLAIFSFSMSLLLFGSLRACLAFTRSHISRDGWKVALAMLLWPLHFWLDITVGWILVLSLLIGIGLAAASLRTAQSVTMNRVHDEVSSYSSAMRVGFPFFLSGTALSIASYGELLMVRIFGAPGDLQPYFNAVILFSYPSLIFNTYFAALLGPYIRQKPRVASLRLQKSWMIVALLSLAMPGAALALGYFLLSLIFPGTTVPWWLAGLLCLVAGLRFLYILISSFIATLATSAQMRPITGMYFAGAIATLPLCAILISFGNDVLLSVAATALIHWLYRIGIGLSLTIRLARTFAAEEGA